MEKQIGTEKEKKQQNDKQQLSAEEVIAEKDKQIKDYERRIEKMRFDNMLNEKLSVSRAKNKKAVRALMDIDEMVVVDGELLGADEQIRAIRAKDGYLFESASTGGGANPSSAKEHVDSENLSDDEYFRMKFSKR